MADKKTEIKRLVIFVVLAFGISWVPAIIFNQIFGFYEWFTTSKMPFFAIPVLYGPALANVITRKLTNEGWHDSMLHLRLKGNLKYYIIAVASVVLMGIAEGVTVTFVYGGGDFSDIGAGMSGVQIAGAVLNILVTIPIMAFKTFGEEFGWRGYMNQKLEPLIGTTGTVIVGGIIWGLWHAELTVVGHNFGTDYSGFPWTGILFMCVLCTFIGMGLMWVTKKTGTIYPAAIMHAAVNFGGKGLGQLFISGVPEDFSVGIVEMSVMQIPVFLICTVFLVLMLKDKKLARAS